LHTGEEAWQRQQVVEQMTANVFHVAPDEPIHRAWRLMHDKQIRHLAVSQEDRPVGILSHRDLLAEITWEAAGPKGIEDQVRHIMTTRLAAVEPQATLADAVIHRHVKAKKKHGALFQEETASLGANNFPAY
jgi:CBS domain-containing protein